MPERSRRDAHTNNGTDASGKTTTGTHSAGPFEVTDRKEAHRHARLGIGVIGCGYWGPNLLRNFHSNRDCTLVAVADLNPDRLAWAKSQYPHIRATAVV